MNSFRFSLASLVLLLVFAALARPSAAADPAPQGAYAAPANFYGAHLLVDSGGGRGEHHLRWARHLVGRWGYAKTLFMGIDKNTRGPAGGWIEYINKCYQLELIPVIRLGGHMRDGKWVKPEADAPGDYRSMAAAVRRVVEGFPRSDLCPLYIEVWNEPNLSVEWSGKPVAAEYADFFVQVSDALRAIGDPRIKVLDGAPATSPEYVEQLCKANPRFAQAFDLWACHPYPANRPPSINYHDKTANNAGHMTIDSYLLELDVLRRFGRDNLQIMITETGYDLGNATFAEWPIIDEYNRADYMVRCFRDYYPKWKEIVAVFPFEFSNEGWERFNWVRPDSGTNPDGSPTRPHYQYTCVAALAKPTDTTGAISGTVTVEGLDSRLEGAKVSIGARTFTTDPMGNYFLERLAPGSYTVAITKPGFKAVNRRLEVSAGRNTVWDTPLVAESRTTLAGTVRGGDDNRPLEGVAVTLAPGNLKAVTSADGTYKLDDVIPATYKLAATLDGRHRYEIDKLEIALGKSNRHDFVLGKRLAPDGHNLIKNPGFEAGGGGAAKPGIGLSYEFVLGPPQVMSGAAFALSERIAHTGRASQSIKGIGDEAVLRQITHYGTARPGARYIGGAWVRSALTGRDAAAWISLDFTDNGGGVISRIDAPARVTRASAEWTWLSIEAEAPPKSERVSLNMHTRGAGGVAYFDDLVLISSER